MYSHDVGVAWGPHFVAVSDGLVDVVDIDKVQGSGTSSSDEICTSIERKLFHCSPILNIRRPGSSGNLCSEAV